MGDRQIVGRSAGATTEKTESYSVVLSASLTFTERLCSESILLPLLLAGRHSAEYYCLRAI